MQASLRVRCCDVVKLGNNSGKKETIHHPAPVRNLSLPKKWWPHRKDFSGRYGPSAFFIRFSYLPPAWKVFLLLRPEKFSKRLSFGGGRVSFVLPYVLPPGLVIKTKGFQHKSSKRQ